MVKDSKNIDPKDNSPSSLDLNNIGLTGQEGEKPPEPNAGDNPPPLPPKNGSDTNVTKQNDNLSSAFFTSTETITVTLMRNRTLYHNGIKHQGGTTLDLPKKDADFLIKNYYAVAGSLLPASGFIVPQVHNPKERDDVG